MSHGDPGGRDPGLAGPGPIVASSVVASTVFDGNGPAVSVTIITIRAADDRLQHRLPAGSRLTYLMLAEPAK